MEVLRVQRHAALAPADDPTGETVLDQPLPYRVWIPGETLAVLGNSQAAEVELDIQAITEEGIKVYKRSGGGGAVILSPDCLCLALRFSRRGDFHIQEYFQAGSAIVSRVLDQVLGLKASPAGISDLAVDGRKLLGCSLYMPRGAALYLGSLLVRDQVPLMQRYLSHPSREPDYRKKRSHAAFVSCLEEVCRQPVDPENLALRFQEELTPHRHPELDWRP